MTSPPLALDDLLATYGNPSDPKFEATELAKFALPYAMTFGRGDSAAIIHQARCHKLAVERFKAALDAIVDAGLQDEASEFNGIYAFRSIRGFGGHLSAHAWGLAIDLNASKLPLGSPKDQHPGVIAAFTSAGFAYGGEFRSRRDPMHFSLTGF